MLIDLSKQKFGRLTVIEKAESTPAGNIRWRCKCECGNFVNVLGSNLRKNHTKSCGCLQIESTKLANTKHGYRRRSTTSSEYATWAQMIQRCTNPNQYKYKEYGARGIKVCDRWIESFENFISDMGNKPLPKKLYSIDRINNNGDYEPNNCRWATSSQQNKNRRHFKRSSK